eukprot:4170278-Pyramimonas_sp.AAC.1
MRQSRAGASSVSGWGRRGSRQDEVEKEEDDEEEAQEEYQEERRMDSGKPKGLQKFPGGYRPIQDVKGCLRRPQKKARGPWRRKEEDAEKEKKQ